MQHHHHILHNEFKHIYQYISHIIRSNMNSIHERHVSSQEKPKRMNHTFSKITIWRNSRKTKRNSRSSHHIAFLTIFPTSQEFCNSDSGWERYVNFSEDAHKFFCHTIPHFSPKCAKFLRQLVMKKRNAWYYIYMSCREKILPWADMQFKIRNN